MNQGDWHVSVYKNPKSNHSFTTLLLGKCASVTTRDDAFILHKALQSLLLRQLGIKSRTKMWHILTANHQRDADIFPKKWKRNVEGCCGYLQDWAPQTPKAETSETKKINHEVEIKIHPWARVKWLLLADKKQRPVMVPRSWSKPQYSLDGGFKTASLASGAIPASLWLKRAPMSDTVWAVTWNIKYMTVKRY